MSDSDTDLVYSGPITDRELRKASRIVRERRARAAKNNGEPAKEAVDVEQPARRLRSKASKEPAEAQNAHHEEPLKEPSPPSKRATRGKKTASSAPEEPVVEVLKQTQTAVPENEGPKTRGKKTSKAIVEVETSEVVIVSEVIVSGPRTRRQRAVVTAPEAAIENVRPKVEEVVELEREKPRTRAKKTTQKPEQPKDIVLKEHQQDVGIIDIGSDAPKTRGRKATLVKAEKENQDIEVIPTEVTKPRTRGRKMVKEEKDAEVTDSVKVQTSAQAEIENVQPEPEKPKTRGRRGAKTVTFEEASRGSAEDLSNEVDKIANDLEKISIKSSKPRTRVTRAKATMVTTVVTDTTCSNELDKKEEVVEIDLSVAEAVKTRTRRTRATIAQVIKMEPAEPLVEEKSLDEVSEEKGEELPYSEMEVETAQFTLTEEETPKEAINEEPECLEVASVPEHEEPSQTEAEVVAEDAEKTVHEEAMREEEFITGDVLASEVDLASKISTANKPASVDEDVSGKDFTENQPEVTASEEPVSEIQVKVEENSKHDESSGAMDVCEPDEIIAEAEQVFVQEFSLEESRFSGCNLSGLNLSFESGVSDPLAVETEKAEEVLEKSTHENNAVPTSLYALACISEFAEKVNITPGGTPAKTNLTGSAVQASPNHIRSKLMEEKMLTPLTCAPRLATPRSVAAKPSVQQTTVEHPTTPVAGTPKGLFINKLCVTPGPSVKYTPPRLTNVANESCVSSTSSDISTTAIQGTPFRMPDILNESLLTSPVPQADISIPGYMYESISDKITATPGMQKVSAPYFYTPRTKASLFSELPSASPSATPHTKSPARNTPQTKAAMFTELPNTTPLTAHTPAVTFSAHITPGTKSVLFKELPEMTPFATPKAYVVTSAKKTEMTTPLRDPAIPAAFTPGTKANLFSELPEMTPVGVIKTPAATSAKKVKMATPRYAPTTPQATPIAFTPGTKASLFSELPEMTPVGKTPASIGVNKLKTPQVTPGTKASLFSELPEMTPVGKTPASIGVNKLKTPQVTPGTKASLFSELPEMTPVGVAEAPEATPIIKNSHTKTLLFSEMSFETPLGAPVPQEVTSAFTTPRARAKIFSELPEMSFSATPALHQATVVSDTPRTRTNLFSELPETTPGFSQRIGHSEIQTSMLSTEPVAMTPISAPFAADFIVTPQTKTNLFSELPSLTPLPGPVARKVEPECTTPQNNAKLFTELPNATPLLAFASRPSSLAGSAQKKVEALADLASLTPLTMPSPYKRPSLVRANQSNIARASMARQSVHCTPVQVIDSMSHLYSPISPADISICYEDAVDLSVAQEVPVEEYLDAAENQQELEEIAAPAESDQARPCEENDMTFASTVTDLAKGAVNDTGISSEATFASAVSEVTNEREGVIAVSSTESIEVIASAPVVEEERMVAAQTYVATVVEEEFQMEEAILLEDEDNGEVSVHESLCDAAEQELLNASLSLLSLEPSPERSQRSSLNGTFDELEMILTMGVDYLDPSKDRVVQDTDVTEPVIDTKQEPLTSGKKFFATPSLKSAVKTPLSKPVLQQGSTTDSKSKVNAGLVRQKKLFDTPKLLRTPQNSRTSSEGKSASLGAATKVDCASKVHVSTPFRVPKTAPVKSAEQQRKPVFKQPTSRIPKPVTARVNMAHVTSPVSQYIHGPNLAPRFTLVRPKSPLPGARPAMTKLAPPKVFSSKDKEGIENANPNAALNLPYVDYTTESSIKVVEHMDTKQKALPNKIKKLMPSPGAVLRHTGRVNIPEAVDGRQEVSILVSHDAIQ